MRVHLALASAIAAVFLSSSASAALLVRPGGFVYDTVLDITWSGDTNYAQTLGASDTGLISHQGASFIAENYIYFNAATDSIYTDWRLPTLGPDVGTFDPLIEGFNGRRPSGQGATGTGWGTPADSGIYSELGWMYYANLGGIPRCEAVGDGPCQFNPINGLPNHGAGPDTGPFPNLKIASYWTDVRVVVPGVNSAFALSFKDGNQSVLPPLGSAYVWLVHQGDVAAGVAATVPEPTTWALMIAGFGAVGAMLRRRAATPVQIRPAF